MRFILFLLTTGCLVSSPPPPKVTVTSPERGMTQSTAGRVVVTGTALPGADGSPIASVTVNSVAAQLAADGSFTANVDVPTGVMLLETVAVTEAGGSATDARAVQLGQLRPVGTQIDRAVTATLSAAAFAKLSAAASSIIKTTNLAALIAPMQPMANLGDDIANVKLSITNLALGDVTISLTPVQGGLAFSATLTGIDVAATADYAGALVPDGSTQIHITANQVTIAGTLVVTPSGTAGFTTTIASPAVHTTNLVLHASGLVGSILDLLDNNLGSTVQDILTSTAESALEPLINDALGALAGPQHIDVLGKQLDLEASPSAISFTPAGALVTMNLRAMIAGSGTSPGYIYTPNGTPAIEMTDGVQLGLADDLVNEMLAEVHALGLLRIHVDQDFGPFDGVDLDLELPPMISGNAGDGKMRLVLGDMVASVTKHHVPVVRAAINAQVDLAIQRGSDAKQIALDFGKLELFVNLLDDSQADTAALYTAATAGLALQLDSLSKLMVTLPLPSIAGVSFDTLSLHGDNGYVVVAGSIH